MILTVNSIDPSVQDAETGVTLFHNIEQNDDPRNLPNVPSVLKDKNKAEMWSDWGYSTLLTLSVQYEQDRRNYFNEILDKGNIAHAVNEKDDKFFEVNLLVVYQVWAPLSEKASDPLST